MNNTKFSLLVMMSCMILHVKAGSPLMFVTPEVSVQLCLYGNQLVEATQASGGAPPVYYALDATDDRFSVEPDTGGVWVDSRRQSMPGNSNVVLVKTAVDSHGATTFLKVNINLTVPNVEVTTSRKMLMFTVREVAPLGEEIGNVDDLTEPRDTQYNYDYSVTLKTASPDGNYMPFNITNDGLLIVSAPLVFRNAICDIFIVDITISSTARVQNHSNCDRNLTHIAARITVQKAGCPSPWSYDLQQNVYLDLPPLTVLQASSIQGCMDTCSGYPLPCNSIVYNVVKGTCTLMNETDITMPHAVQRRMGSFFYRKMCHLLQLPSFSLRQLNETVEAHSMLTPSTSIRLFSDLLARWNPFRLEPTTNTRLVAHLITRIVQLTDTLNEDQGVVHRYVELYGILVDRMFLDVRFEHRTMEVQIDILDGFDAMLKSLTQLPVNTTLDVQTNATRVSVDRLTITEHFHKRIKLGYTGTSHVTLHPSSDKNTNITSTSIVTGVMSGITHNLNSNLTGDDSDISIEAIRGPVLAVVLGAGSVDVTDVDVQLDIPTVETEKIAVGRTCVFFHLADSLVRWSADGCVLVGYNSSHTRCRCSHLTNFAVLMQLNEFQIPEIHAATLDLLTVIGCCVSITSLITTVAILLWLRLTRERYVLFMNLAVAIVLSQTVFVLGIDATRFQIMCRIVAVLLHYLFLSVFALMLAEGVYFFHRLHLPFSEPINILMFLVLGWGSPVLIVLLSLSMDIQGYGDKNSCWLSRDGVIWAFVGPALCVLMINLCILVMILRTFLLARNNAKKAEIERFKSAVKVSLILLPSLGTTWLFGVLSVNSSSLMFQYMFSLLNTLQGLFLFFIHVAFNPEVRRAVSMYRSRAATLIDIVSKEKEVRKGGRYIKRSNNQS